MATTRRNAMLIAEARQKIRTTQLINRLQDHALGKIEMSKTQVTATAILLRKSVPDLSSVEYTQTDKRDAREYSEDELIAIASRGRAAPEAESPPQHRQLH